MSGPLTREGAETTPQTASGWTANPSRACNNAKSSIRSLAPVEKTLQRSGWGRGRACAESKLCSVVQVHSPAQRPAGERRQRPAELVSLPGGDHGAEPLPVAIDGEAGVRQVEQQADDIPLIHLLARVL